MHIMTENGWKSLGGVAERIAAAAKNARDNREKLRQEYLALSKPEHLADRSASFQELKARHQTSVNAFNTYYNA